MTHLDDEIVNAHSLEVGDECGARSVPVIDAAIPRSRVDLRPPSPDSFAVYLGPGMDVCALCADEAGILGALKTVVAVEQASLEWHIHREVGCR